VTSLAGLLGVLLATECPTVAAVGPDLVVHVEAGAFTSVHVPFAGVADGVVRYRAAAGDGVRLVSRVEGSAADGGTFVSFGAAATLPAGRHRAVTVVFTPAAAVPYCVRVLAELPVTRGIEVRAAEAPAIHARFSVPWRVTVRNAGNATDTISLSADAPAGWTVVVPAPFELAAGMAHDVELTIRPPRDGGSGVAPVRLQASGDSGAADTVATFFSYQGAVAATVSGPVLTTGVALAHSRDGTPAALFSGSLEGALGPAVRIALHGTHAARSSMDDRVARGWSRVAAQQRAPSASLAVGGWRLDAGPLGGRVADPFGAFVLGTGVGLQYESPLQQGRAVVVDRSRHDGPAIRSGFAEYRFGSDEANLRAGAVYESRDGVESVGGSTGAAVRLRQVLHLDGAVGYAERGGDRGFGWSGSAALRRNTSYVQVQHRTAPLDAVGFSSAPIETGIDGHVELGGAGRVSFAGRTSGSSPESSVEVENQHLSLRYEVPLVASLLLATAANAYEYAVTEPAVSFGGRERGGQIGLRRPGAGSDIEFGVTLLHRNRSHSLDGQRHDLSDGWRAGVRASAYRFIGAGMLRGDLSYDAPTAAAAMPARLYWSAGAHRLTFVPLPAQLALDVEVRGTIHTGDAQGIDLARAALFMPVSPSVDFRLGVEAQRSAHKAGWRPVFSVGYQHRIGFSSPNIGVGAGRVTFDDDADGRADRAAAGIRVLVGGRMHITDEHGRFPRPRAGEPVSVDPASLPDGWRPGRVAAGDIMLVPASRLRISLQLDIATLASTEPPVLSRLLIVVRDEAGREWLTRPDLDGQAELSALPPGVYTIELDSREAGETLRILDSMGSFEMPTGELRLPVRIGGRPARMRSLDMTALQDGAQR
jgi:hypothetical protein